MKGLNFQFEEFEITESVGQSFLVMIIFLMPSKDKDDKKRGVDLYFQAEQLYTVCA